MPAPSPQISSALKKALRGLGQELRARRKALRISAAAASEAAGMSRVTLHRIERGEASVTIGAYLAAISSLGLELELTDPERRVRDHESFTRELPERIRVADYPQLRRLAWQLQGAEEIAPEDALEIYERNWRHLDPKAIDPGEQALIQALLAAFGRKRLLV